MAKIAPLDDIATLTQSSAIDAINENWEKITDAFNNTLSRRGDSPNDMDATLDMNSNRILNLPEPTEDTDPVRLIDVALVLEYNDVLAAALAAADRAEAAQAIIAALLSDLDELVNTDTLHASAYNVIADHTRGTYLTGTANIRTDVRDWLTAGHVQRKTCKWTGGILYRGTESIDLGDNRTFALEGKKPDWDYIYLYDDITTFGNFFLKFGDGFSLWTGSQRDTFQTHEAVLQPAPPPENWKMKDFSNFAIFGRGSDINGNVLANQGGICFYGRHDHINMHNVHFYNLYGTALHMGYPTPIVGNGGIRESESTGILIRRCGTPTKAAWIIEGRRGTSGPNHLIYNDCECSLSRGDQLLIRNSTTNDSTHVLIFNDLKMHGTGTTYPTNPGASAIPDPGTKRGITITGNSSNITFNNANINQNGYDGSYVINCIAPDQDISCVAMTTVATNLTTDVDAGSVIDGVTLVEGDLIFHNVIAGHINNGVWVVPAAAGTANRHVSMDTTLEFPHKIVRVTGGATVDTIDTYWQFESATPPVVGVDTITFHRILHTTGDGPQYKYPHDIVFKNLRLTGAANGIKLDGGYNYDFHCISIGGSTNTVSIGEDIEGLVALDLPKRNNARVISNAFASKHVEFKHSILNNIILPNAAVANTNHYYYQKLLDFWTVWRRQTISATSVITNGTTTLDDIEDLTISLDAGGTYLIKHQVPYYAHSAGDIKYTLSTAAGLTLTSVDLVTAYLLPGATVPAVTTGVAALPAAVVLDGTVTGPGLIEVSGIYVVNAAGDLRFSFAQNAVHATLTEISRDSSVEYKKLFV